MAKVRARADSGMLFLDFYFRGVRCREQTALPNTPENLKKVEGFLNRIMKDIAQGMFDYAATFPGSPKGARFAKALGASAFVAPSTSHQQGRGADSIESPTFADFSLTWRAEMAPQWRRLHRAGVDDIFSKNLNPTFGEKCFGEIAKADVLNFRAALAELPGRAGKKLSASRINKIMCILRQILNEGSERFQTPAAFRGIKPLKARRPDVGQTGDTHDSVEALRKLSVISYRHGVRPQSRLRHDHCTQPPRRSRVTRLLSLHFAMRSAGVALWA